MIVESAHEKEARDELTTEGRRRYLRLRDTADPEPDQTSEDQHPDEVGRQGAQQPEVKREQ